MPDGIVQVLLRPAQRLVVVAQQGRTHGFPQVVANGGAHLGRGHIGGLRRRGGERRRQQRLLLRGKNGEGAHGGLQGRFARQQPGQGCVGRERHAQGQGVFRRGGGTLRHELKARRESLLLCGAQGVLGELAAGQQGGSANADQHGGKAPQQPGHGNNGRRAGHEGAAEGGGMWRGGHPAMLAPSPGLGKGKMACPGAAFLLKFQ